MAENLMKVPVKGILKNSASFEGPGSHKSHAPKGGPKWDEMNILATHHPPDKDYGHMKIDEPKTPFSYDMEDGESGDEADSARKLDSALLQQKLEQGARRPSFSEGESELDEDEDETPEMKEKRLQFEKRRKDHYNEYMAVQLARKLMEKDEEEDLEDDPNKLPSEDAMEEGVGEEEATVEEGVEEAAEADESTESRKS